MAGEHGLGGGGAEPHRAQGRHPADETIHQDGQVFQCAAKEDPAQPGDVKAAQFGQHVQRVGSIGLVAGDAAPDGVQLAGQPGVGKARAPPGHDLDGLAEQDRRHSAGRGGVADAHLAGGEQLVPLRLLRPHQFDARRDGLHSLGAGHGGALGEVCRSGGDAAGDDARHRCACHAHVHRHDLAAGRFCHLANARPPRRKVFGHGAGHALVGLAHALGHDAVVRAEHEDGPAVKGELRRAGQGSGVFQQGLQCAQPAQRLGQAGPVGVCGRAGGLAGRSDGGEKLFQFRFGHGVCSFW